MVEPADPRGPERRRVAYADDDEALLFLLRRQLELRGWRVTTFARGEELVDALRARPACFDLVITDLHMPGMSGLDVARAALDLEPRLAVVLFTGHDSEFVRERALAEGIREVVRKPDAAEDFDVVVAALVAHAPS